MSQAFIVPATDRDAMIARLGKFIGSCLPGKRLKVTIEQHRKPRSYQQSKALWGLAYKVLHDETGNDAEDLHAYFCGEYFSWVEYTVMGQTRKRPLRTTTTDADGKHDVLSTVAFADFFSFVQQRSAEVAGVFIPDPDPLWRENVDRERQKEAAAA